MFVSRRIFENVYVLKDCAKCCGNLVIGAERALLFDTGSGIDSIRETVEKLTQKPVLVINSHGHADHIGGNDQFDTAYIHSRELVMQKQYGKESVKWKNVRPLDFDAFDLGNLQCRIVLLPGHTRGSVGVLIPEMRLLLSGDALLPVMSLIFENHLSVSDQYKTLWDVWGLDFDF